MAKRVRIVQENVTEFVSEGVRPGVIRDENSFTEAVAVQAVEGSPNGKSCGNTRVAQKEDLDATGGVREHPGDYGGLGALIVIPLDSKIPTDNKRGNLRIQVVSGLKMKLDLTLREDPIRLIELGGGIELNGVDKKEGQAHGSDTWNTRRRRPSMHADRSTDGPNIGTQNAGRAGRRLGARKSRGARRKKVPIRRWRLMRHWAP